MNSLKPWTYGPFELILHAESHLREGGDFDKRIAMIGFDNSVEVSITTYLNLHPIQRANRQYENDDVKKWLKNYYTKLDFIECEADQRGINLEVPKDEIAWYHKIRNDQHHGGSAGVPDDRSLAGIRKAAICVFSILFDMDDVDEVLENALQVQASQQEEKPQRDSTLDKLLDIDGEEIIIAGQPYPLSEALFSIDPDAYLAELAAIEHSHNFLQELQDKYPNYVRKEITSAQFVHYNDKAYLKTTDLEGKITLEDLGYVIEDIDNEKEMFPATSSANENASKFLEQFEPYSIINCTELFSEKACAHITEELQMSDCKGK